MLSEASTPARCDGADLSIIEASSVPLSKAIDLLVVLKPMGDLLGGRLERQEASKDLSRAFDEELVVAAVLREQRLRKRQCFRAVLNLIARTPVRHPRSRAD